MFYVWIHGIQNRGRGGGGGGEDLVKIYDMDASGFEIS